jgi:hypothetical protein
MPFRGCRDEERPATIDDACGAPNKELMKD